MTLYKKWCEAKERLQGLRGKHEDLQNRLAAVSDPYAKLLKKSRAYQSKVNHFVIHKKAIKWYVAGLILYFFNRGHFEDLDAFINMLGVIGLCIFVNMAAYAVILGVSDRLAIALEMKCILSKVSTFTTSWRFWATVKSLALMAVAGCILFKELQIINPLLDTLINSSGALASLSPVESMVYQSSPVFAAAFLFAAASLVATLKRDKAVWQEMGLNDQHDKQMFSMEQSLVSPLDAATVKKTLLSKSVPHRSGSLLEESLLSTEHQSMNQSSASNPKGEGQ